MLFLPTTEDEIEWLLILLSLVSIGEAGGLSYKDAEADEDVDEVTLPAVFGCGGETICPLNIVAEFWCANPGRTKAAALAGPKTFVRVIKYSISKALKEKVYSFETE